MNKNLLIVGAGVYAHVAAEIAADMGSFEKIAFIDDTAKISENGMPVVGTTEDINHLAGEYSHIVVAIGNPEVRLSLLDQIQKETTYQLPALISPKAYISPSAKVMRGCIVEPMAVVHFGCVLEEGCIISAGAVVNHKSTCRRGVHVDCNATVAGYVSVPAGTKVCSGEVYRAV